MASPKFSNFSIDYILGDSSSQTPSVDHPSSPRDLLGNVPKPDQLHQDGSGGHGEHPALMMNHHPSSSAAAAAAAWAGMYSCCEPVSYYQMTFNSRYYAAQQWPYNTPGCDPENRCHQQNQKQRNRVRTVFTDNQSQELERLFAITDYPTADARAELAKSTGLTEEIVRVWFKNRRARRKRQASCPGKSAKCTSDVQDSD